MKVGDLVKMQSRDRIDPLGYRVTGDQPAGIIIDQPRPGSSTVLWSKEDHVMTTWNNWLEVVNES